jgi:hypothetical protein
MIYVTFDLGSGALTGAYDQELHPDHAGNYFELTEPLEQHWTAYRMNEARDGLELLPAPVPTEPPAPAPLPRHITTLAFDNRFTQDELVALELASIDDPAGTVEQRTLAANLRIYQRKVDRATYIDLDRADTRAGVLALEQFGVLAAGRAQEILDAEVADIERVPG